MQIAAIYAYDTIMNYENIGDRFSYSMDHNQYIIEHNLILIV